MRMRSASIRSGSGRGETGRPRRSTSLATAESMLCPLCWSIPSTVGRLFEQGQAGMIDYSSILVDVGARLRQERERRGMNQTEFATIGGVKRGSQLEYEAGKRPCDIQYLLKLIEIGVDTHYVLTGQRQAANLEEKHARLFSAFGAMRGPDQDAILQLACTITGQQAPSATIKLPSTAALADAFGGLLEASPGLAGDELAHELATRLPIILRSAEDEIVTSQSSSRDHLVAPQSDHDADRRAAQRGRRI